jgi:hypothetical protein
VDPEACFRRAAAFLVSAEPKGVLQAVLPSAGRLDDIAALVSHVDHVGFLSPLRDASRLSLAARAAGFAAGERMFPSEIAARELGNTTIFQAWGTAPSGEPILAEAFMPLDVPTTVLAGWAREGVGSDVGVSVTCRRALRDVVSLMTEEGCRMPAFMEGEPLRNAAEKLTVAYFDGCHNGRRVRIELCHRA